jgi:hypothetical protein
MAKGQQRSNREAKKPKANKKTTIVPPDPRNQVTSKVASQKAGAKASNS